MTPAASADLPAPHDPPAVVAVSAPPPTTDPAPHPLARWLIALVVLATLYTVHLAQGVLVPIAVALLLDFLLSPLIRWFNRRGLPNGVAAALVMLTGLGAVGAAGAALIGPATNWIGRAPAELAQVERRMRNIARPLVKLQETTERVEKAATAASDGRTPTTVKVESRSLFSRASGGLAAFGGGALTVIFLTFFLLASGDLFMQRSIAAIPLLSDKKKAVRIAREIETSVSRYLVVVTGVNVGLGLATWGTLSLLGMPNGMLWGAVAAILNYIPYLGAMITTLIIALAALATFDEASKVLLMPGAFLVLNMIESNLISPIVLGRRFPLNSVALFVGLLVWFYLWGIAGAILAVPLMVTLAICCEHVEALAPYGHFLRR